VTCKKIGNTNLFLPGVTKQEYARFQFSSQTKTSSFGGTKFLWALPALALLLFAFAEPVYKMYSNESVNAVSSMQKGEKELVLKGKVVQEETGKPLPGASVIIKGTTVGTISDKDGNFTLINPNPQKGENGRNITEVVILM
jgi:hypothetical protein